MATTSTNLGLTLPEESDYVSLSVFNNNYDIIDNITAPNDENALYSTTLTSSGLSIESSEYTGWVVVETAASASNARVVLQCGALKQGDVAFSSGDTLYVSLPIKVGQAITVSCANVVDTGTVKVYSYFEADDE